MDVNKDRRNSSIELLRILSMLGVVILHYNNAGMGGGLGYVRPGSINEGYLFLSEAISINAVDVFILISAFFLSKSYNRKKRKIVELLIQVSVFRAGYYLLTVIQTGVFSIKELINAILPVNYFIILYAVLYFISPYINRMLDSLSDVDTKRFIIRLFLIFSVWAILVDYLQKDFNFSLDGLSPIGLGGSDNGYTIVNFALVYIIGYGVRRFSESISKKKTMLFLSLSIIFIFMISMIERKENVSAYITWNYNNPLIIIASACIVIAFAKMSFYSRIVNELSKAAFTCFLIHTVFIHYLGIKQFVNGNLVILIGHQLACAVILYLVSYVVYKIYWLVSNPLYRKIL